MELKDELRSFIDCAVDAFIVYDAKGRILDASFKALCCFGYSREQLARLRISDLIITQDLSWQPVCNEEPCNSMRREAVCQRSDGSKFPAEVMSRVGRSDAQAVTMMIIRDISQQKQSEEQLVTQDYMFRTVFHASGDAALLLDGATFIDCNESAVKMLRCDRKEDLLPTPPWSLSPERQPDGRFSSEKAEEMIRKAYENNFHRFEWVHTRADGEDFPVEVTLTPINLDGRNILYTVWSDITDRKNYQRQIETLARYDLLTGLPNRQLLHECGQQTLDLASRQNKPVAVLYMDLDRFKDINDTQGHDVGDAVLVAVTERFQQWLRSSDTAARLGGDEFAFLLPETDKHQAMDVANRLLSTFDTPFEIAGISAQLGASIGIVSYPEDGNKLTELLKNADIAMYEAKEQGTGISVFHNDHAQKVSRRVLLERALRQAVSNEELSLQFQPRIHAVEGTIHSVEALARWCHPEYGWVSPAEFIPIAETSGIIHVLGKSLLASVCQQLVEWRHHNIGVRIALNVSVLELQRNDFVQQIKSTLEQYSLGGDALEIEITESAAMNNPELNIKTLSAIKDLGIHIAVDDFGTGYSSLSYLKRLPVDSLKVDRSFVSGMTVDAVDADIIKSIITLAKSMALETVAEGVETIEQAEALRQLECSYLQGFFFCKPLSARDIQPLLHQKAIPLPW